MFKQSPPFYCTPLSAHIQFCTPQYPNCTPSLHTLKGGGVHCQCRNSMNAYSDQENVWCTRVETFINTLYDDECNIGYACAGFVRSVPVSWTQQTPRVHACGPHFLSHIYRTSKGLTHTHTFANVFVEEMRKYCVQSLYENRFNRRTTRAYETYRFDTGQSQSPIHDSNCCDNIRNCILYH